MFDELGENPVREECQKLKLYLYPLNSWKDCGMRRMEELGYKNCAYKNVKVRIIEQF